MWTWLSATIGSPPEAHLTPALYWHGRAMVLGWGILLPVGALVARYLKILPGQDWPRRLDTRTWWHAHLALQWLGVLVMSAGMALAWGQAGSPSSPPMSPASPMPAARLHAALGWMLLIVGWLQVAGGLLRGTKGGPTDCRLRGDHYDMTARRRWFERLHKSVGWIALAAAVVTIALGLWQAGAPRWMAVVLLAWWLLLGVIGWRWQRQGRCIDTYQAIWGPGAEHPGNALPPIGWGVRRPPAWPPSLPPSPGFLTRRH